MTKPLAGRVVLFSIPTIDGRISISLTATIQQASLMLAVEGARMGMLYQSNCSIISKARNALVSEFLGIPEATDMFCLDSDMGIAAEDIVKMVHLATANPIVAACYVARGDPPEYHADFGNLEDGISYSSDGLIEANGIPAGVLLVRREVLETMRDNLLHRGYSYKDRTDYPLFDFSIRDGKYMGEDFLFCRQAQECGYKIMVDPRIHVGHAWLKEYRSSLYEDVLRHMPEKQST